MWRWVWLLGSGLWASCDATGELPDAGGKTCPTHDQASFELGTGELAFEPIADEARLPITPGPQGGCHFFLSLTTDGFAERRFRVEYEVFRADDGTSTGSSSVFTVRLAEAPEQPGKCQTLGLTAFLIQPWKFENERVRIEVEVTDDEGRTARQEKTVIADWPASLSENACGIRTD